MKRGGLMKNRGEQVRERLGIIDWPRDDVAEMLRLGASIQDLAAAYGIQPESMRRSLGRAGWGVDGRPLPTMKPAPRPEPVRRTGWFADAACSGVGWDLFFPEAGDSARDAKRLCRGCAVRNDCLQWALEHGERHGVWGGLSPDERDRLHATRPS